MSLLGMKQFVDTDLQGTCLTRFHWIAAFLGDVITIYRLLAKRIWSIRVVARMFLFIFISGEWYCSIVVTTQKPQLLLDRKRVFKRMDFYCQVRC
nr:hypothetical protein BaRGS_002357 [Batillaria attramentaria]